MQMKFNNKTTYITQYYKLVLQNIMLRDMVTLILSTKYLIDNSSRFCKNNSNIYTLYNNYKF